MRYSFFVLFILAAMLPESGKAQDAVADNPVIIYELSNQSSQKPDANRVSAAIIPGVERQFFCMQSKVLYIEVAASQAQQCEAYLNNRGIVCLPKKGCSLSQVEEQCSTLNKTEN